MIDSVCIVPHRARRFIPPCFAAPVTCWAPPRAHSARFAQGRRHGLRTGRLWRRCLAPQANAARPPPDGDAARRGSGGESKGPLRVAADAQRVYAAGKPWWCQPWSIVLTGAAVVLASWGGAARGWGGWLSVVFAIGASGGVALWWYVFLVLYPQSELSSSTRSSDGS